MAPRGLLDIVLSPGKVNSQRYAKKIDNGSAFQFKKKSKSEKVLEICFVACNLKINPVFTVSTKAQELVAPAGPLSFGRTANREHGRWPVSALMSLARLDGN